MCNRKGLVSCVTPVYNGESHLELMLDSVLGQTYPWVEMILVDDGSTDRTLEMTDPQTARWRLRRATEKSLPERDTAIRSFIPRIRTLRPPSTAGFCRLREST